MRSSGLLVAFAAGAIGAGVLGGGAPARGASSSDPNIEVTVVVDGDDDDGDGVADDLAPKVGSTGLDELTALDDLPSGLVLKGVTGTGGVRVLCDGKPLATGAALPRHAKVALQGVRPGLARVDLGPIAIGVRVVEATALDGRGARVDFTKSHASIERTPPDRTALPGAPPSGDPDPDALVFQLVGPKAALPSELSIVSTDPTGMKIDALDRLVLVDVPCPAGVPVELTCRSSVAVRAVVDDVDRNHPLVVHRSLRAVVGGMLNVVVGDRRMQSIRVGGPRESPAGPISRLRGRLRVWLVRDHVHGSPPFGTDDAAAIDLARQQIGWTNAVWGQCGIQFGREADAEIHVVDPPPPWLVAVGCEAGLPASGGELVVRIDGREIHAPVRPGVSPDRAARALAKAIDGAGFVARVSPNARIEPGANGAADVLVRHKDGSFARVEPPASGPLARDDTMTACIGEVDFSDGLDHFTDVDAPAGTLEERTLIKAYDDGDPTTIDIFMIPAFSGGGRIGESFIFGDRSSIRNVVLEDRAGVRADRASFALAHELGHILLDMPGHPDDFGLDVPTLLMDSDAADASAFGPRRLTLADCARALVESGPASPVPLLQWWPLTEPAAPTEPVRRRSAPPHRTLSAAPSSR